MSEVSASTVSELIAQKLDTLVGNPEKAEPKVILELLKIPQEDRVVSHEEIEELESLEDELLEKQEDFKEVMKDMKNRINCSIRLCLYFVVPIHIVWALIYCNFESPIVLKCIYQLTYNSYIHVLAMALYLFPLMGAFEPLESTEPEDSEDSDEDSDDEYDEGDDEDDWEDSMTSSEVKTRQRVLVCRSELFKCEYREEFIKLERRFVCAQLINLSYFLVRLVAIILGPRSMQIDGYRPLELFLTLMILVCLCIHGKREFSSAMKNWKVIKAR